MRYGKPVIGCNVGGMKEIIVHEKQDYSVNLEILKASKYVERLIIDKDKRQNGTSRIERLNSHFTDEIVCKEAWRYIKADK